MKKYRNVSNPHSPVWANEAHTIIDLTVTIDGFEGEHAFTAMPSDPEPHGVELFNDAVAGVFGPIGDYVPPTMEQLAAMARHQRDMLISMSDWTQSADVPQALKDKWAPYRQALRDVPQQPDFPMNIVWPTPPV